YSRPHFRLLLPLSLPHLLWLPLLRLQTSLQAQQTCMHLHLIRCQRTGFRKTLLLFLTFRSPVVRQSLLPDPIYIFSCSIPFYITQLFLIPPNICCEWNNSGNIRISVSLVLWNNESFRI